MIQALFKKTNFQSDQSNYRGTVVTAILQSSSIVNFLVLSFVGAGILKISNALAIVLGANLGTTLSSWVIATLGFQMNLENLSFPLIAIGGLLMFMSDKVGKIYYWVDSV
ncbi:MAG: Na/Pi symporter [Saprospiraceae bacterium]|nr:Na/Pi symporter [Saprospiraceae bacterium]